MVNQSNIHLQLHTEPSDIFPLNTTSNTQEICIKVYTSQYKNAVTNCVAALDKLNPL